MVEGCEVKEGCEVMKGCEVKEGWVVCVLFNNVEVTVYTC